MDWQTSEPTGLEAAIAEFKQALPGWWYTVGECQVSADASCGPTRQAKEISLIAKDRRFDDGFHADLEQPASMADALRDVMRRAREAIDVHSGPRKKITAFRNDAFNLTKPGSSEEVYVTAVTDKP